MLTQLEAARSRARAVDVAGVKVGVTQWEDFNPAVPPDNKAIRGFNHPEIAALLCPITHDPTDPAYVLFFS